MFKEIMQFMDAYAGESTKDISEIARRYSKIIIVEANEKMEYTNFYVLLSKDSKTSKKNQEKDEAKIKFKTYELEDWLSRNNQSKAYLDFDKYICPTIDKNKCIGSRSSLLSCSLFHIKFKDTWFGQYEKKSEKKALSSIKNSMTADGSIFEQKVKKFKYASSILKNTDKKGLNEKINKIYLDFYNDIVKKLDTDKENIYGLYKNKNKKAIAKTEPYKTILRNTSFLRDSYVFLKLPIVHEHYINELHSLIAGSDRAAFNKEKLTKNNTTCPLCLAQNQKIGFPSGYNRADKEKRFIFHRTKKEETPFMICKTCSSKINQFESFLKEMNIDFFPLFLKENAKKEAINYLKNEKKEKRFFDLIEHINKKIKTPSELDFMLLFKKGENFYCDYISNYEHQIGLFKDYFRGNEQEVTKRDLLTKFNIVLPLLQGNFFGEVEGKKLSSTQRYLVYTYREKIFNLIYRNNVTLTENDVNAIALTVIEAYLENGDWDRNAALTSLNIYLNADTFLKGGINMPSKWVEDIREKVRTPNGEICIANDKECAYLLGQLIHYLILHSNSDKKERLIQPITNCRTIQTFRRVFLENYVDKYTPRLSFMENKIIARTIEYLDTKLQTQFNDLKLPLYAGYFDKNIFEMGV